MRQSVKGGPNQAPPNSPKTKMVMNQSHSVGVRVLVGVGGKGVTAQVACFFVDPSASQNSPSKRWQRARIKAFFAGIEY